MLASTTEPRKIPGYCPTPPQGELSERGLKTLGKASISMGMG